MAAGLALALSATAAVAQSQGAASATSETAPAFDREPWLADYAGLKEAMARGYANLDWIVRHRGLDLVELDRETTTQLEAAGSVREALAAISAFTETFSDNHLRGNQGRAPEAALRNAARGEPREGEEADPEALPVAEPLSLSCAQLGYEDGRRMGAFDPAALPEWRRIDSPWFTAGVAGNIGLIRIPSFSETEYLPACEASWQPDLIPREIQLATRAALQGELTRLAAALREAGAEVLALDVTANGGGSEWSEEAATLFTSREIARPSPRLVETRCDRSGVWRGEAVCANLSLPGETDRRAGQGAWDGPLAVLVGRQSASAAEDFAYWLSGSGVASLVGERTFGAGCGYMDGGRAYQFTAIEGYVMMPNCSRYTEEGVNQIEGLEPDIAFDWESDLLGLPAALDRIAAPAR